MERQGRYDRHAELLAPEVAKALLNGETKSAKSKQDVFSLGVILFELFAGEDLLDSGDRLALLAEWTTEKLRQKLDAINDAEFKALLEGMLQPEPEDRLDFDSVVTKTLHDEINKTKYLDELSNQLANIKKYIIGKGGGKTKNQKEHHEHQRQQ